MVTLAAFAGTVLILAFVGWTAFRPRRHRQSREQLEFWSVVNQHDDWLRHPADDEMP
jgi:hypothetical protein